MNVQPQPPRLPMAAVAPPEVSVSAGTAFKIGFFGAFGVFIASLVPFAILILVIIAASIIHVTHTEP